MFRVLITLNNHQQKKEGNKIMKSKSRDYKQIYKQIKRLRNNTTLIDCLMSGEYIKTRQGIKCQTSGIVYEWDRFKNMPILILSLKRL